MDDNKLKSILTHIHNTIIFGILLIVFLVIGMNEQSVAMKLLAFAVCTICSVILLIQLFTLNEK